MLPSRPSPADAPSPNDATVHDTAFGTWTWEAAGDAVTVYVPANPSGGRSMPLGEWLGLGADEVGAWLREWRTALDAGLPWSRECDVAHADGVRRVLLRARGGPHGGRLEGVWLDVTQEALVRADAAQRAREQDERLRLAQEAGRVGAFEWRVAEQRVEWSPELERLYDLPPGAFGSSVTVWAEHVHPDDVPVAVATVQAAMMRRDETCEFEFRARLRSGDYRWLAGRVRFIYAPDGTPVKMIGVNTDIDARKRSEVALRESEAWFRHLADALPILVWAAAPDGSVDYANEAWRHFSGHVDAADWWRVVHPDDTDRLRDCWDQAVRDRDRFEARVRLRRAHDGQYRWHSVRAVPIAAPHGALIRWVGAFIDDHELRMLVEANQHLLASEQRARQAAEDAGRLKDDFLATLGHELRTPLNAITGWTSLLRRGDLDVHARQRAIEVIERNADAQRRLIDELLDMSRIISGHVRLDLQPLSLAEVITQAVETVRPIAEARQQDIAVQLADAPATLTGDAARLQQVFANLLGNAVKFTPPLGHIAVALVPAADHVTVHVSDDGIGIDPGFLPHVFDRFRQADAAGRPAGGLGLGLSIVRQIVQLHGGRVSAHSAGEGTGTTFTVTLPLDARPAPPDPAPRDAALPAWQPGESLPATLRGLSMLLIEDDPDSREMLSVLLENAGAVPVPAASVSEGLRLLGDLEIDVVLSDIGMPERDGFDLIRSLRTFPNPRVRRAPAVAVTAFARREDRDRILGAGFDAHVSKPVEPADLFATIAEVVQRRMRDNEASGLS